MEIKEGVNLTGLRPEILLAVLAANRIWAGMGQTGQILVITSALDRAHSHGSLHYTGCAVDFRTNYFTPEEAGEAHATLKMAMGAQYDVVLEADHIHVEFQPKGLV